MKYLTKEQKVATGGFLSDVYNGWIEKLLESEGFLNWYRDDTFMRASDKIMEFLEDASKLCLKHSNVYISTNDPQFLMSRLKVVIEGHSVIYITVEKTKNFSFKYEYEILCPNFNKDKETIIFFPDGAIKIFYKQNYIPLSFRKMLFLSNNNEMFRLFMETWFEYRTESLYKDVLRDYKQNYLNCAISVEEVKKYHSYQELIMGHYKTCKNVPKSVNKMPLNEAVAKALLCRNIKAENQQKIYQTHTLVSYDLDELSILREYYHSVLDQAVCIHEEQYGETELCEILRDYYNMAKTLHLDVNLKIQSARKLIDAHNNLLNPYMEKMARKNGTRRMKVDMKFKSLNLPDNWELINTGKRLYAEGEIMHHCVYSYLPLVNKGECCIYHMEYGNRLYTLEIKVKRKKYVCVQMYGRFNKPAPTEVWDYVQKILSEQDIKRG